MGRKLVLSGTKLSNPAAPRLAEIDLILPNQGALMFVDPSHPYEPWGSGVPLSEGAIPNLAHKQAMATTGLSEAQVTPKLFKSSTFDTGNIAERTGKGGLHTILTQAPDSAEAPASAHLYLEANTGTGGELAKWLLANKGHSFYAAKWGRWTRGVGPAPLGGFQHSSIMGGNQFISFFSRGSGSGEVTYPQAPRVGWNAVNQTPAVPGAHFVDAAVSSGVDATTTSFYFHRANRGAFGADGAIYVPSEIFYGYYLEDLTVSGRTYAQVHEAVKAKYTRDVMTEGGRYYGDTFTDPATNP